MITRRYTLWLTVICVILSALLVMTSCDGGGEASLSGDVSSAGSNSEDESIPDYFPSYPDDESDTDETSGETSGSQSDPEGTSGSEGVTSAIGSDGASTGGTTSTGGSNPAPTVPPISGQQNEYPDTPGETSIRKMPQFAFELENNVVKFLSSSPLGETSLEQLKAFQSLTKIKLDIQVEVVPWENLTTTLASKVLGNNSPDMFSIGAETTPYLVRQNYFQSVWDYINMNDALWKETKNMNLLAFSNGVQYAVAPGDPGFLAGIIYNKVLFDENDLEYPFDLYKKGAWTWDALYDAAKAINVDSDNDGVPEVLGASLPDFVFGMLVNSTGSDFIKYDNNGKIVNNLKDPNIQRAADFTFKIGALGYDNENWMWTNRFVANKIGMVQSNAWGMTTGPMLELKEQGKIGWVPIPKDPKADKYYAQANTFFTYIPKGAKNPEGVAAWLYFQRYAIKNPSPLLEQNQKKIAIEQWHWTEEEYQFINKDIAKQLTPIIGVGERVPDFSMQHYLWEMPFKYPWSQTLEEVNPAFQAALDAFNNR